MIVAVEYQDKHAGYYFHRWFRFSSTTENPAPLDPNEHSFALYMTEKCLTNDNFDANDWLFYMTPAKLTSMDQGTRTNRFFVIEDKEELIRGS